MRRLIRFDASGSTQEAVGVGIIHACVMCCYVPRPARKERKTRPYIKVGSSLLQALMEQAQLGATTDELDGERTRPFGVLGAAAVRGQPILGR